MESTLLVPELPTNCLPLHQFAEEAYLAYAMSVVKGRALPAVEDGQKPVHRRILFAMRELSNWSNTPFKKSARIVGDVIGKYHPHGDSSVYEAAVRMSQSFSLRYPLIEGQGNFGSRDGDGAAAMRYTEVRLSRFAETILLEELDKGTVDFLDNYDGQLKEPQLLPARLPLLLLNGTTGIAVGMATDIPSHHLKEIAAACECVVRSPDVLDDELIGMISGPDFPAGAQIISSPEDIRKVYSSGRGSVRVRARWTIEPLARNQWRIAITEIPPGASTAKFLSEIDDLSNPKIKSGKKALTLEQQNMKTSLLSLLDTARDDSDQDHPIRILLEPKTARVSPDDLMALLLANTGLESNVSINMVMIGLDGRPQQKSLPLILREWASFRMMTVIRRLSYRLKEVEHRLHILKGRMIAFTKIESVIHTIREADNPRLELMFSFQLSEIQADDILEIRLRQLARLEGIKIEQEIKSLTQESAGLNHLLLNETDRRSLIISEIRSDALKFSDERRSLILPSSKITASKVESITDELVTVILSKNGFIRTRQGHGLDHASIVWKANDHPLAILETRTTTPVVVFDTHGRVYTLKPSDIPGGKGDGVPITSLIDLQNQRIIAAISTSNETRLLLASTAGSGLCCKFGDLVSRNRTGKVFFNTGEDATLLMPALIESSSAHLVATVSSQGRLLVFHLEELRELNSGGKGVTLMGLNDHETLSLIASVSSSFTIRGVGSSGGEKERKMNSILNEYINRRSKGGKALPDRMVKVISIF